MSEEKSKRQASAEEEAPKLPPQRKEKVAVVVTTSGTLDLPGASYTNVAGQTLRLTEEQADYVVANGLGSPA